MGQHIFKSWRAGMEEDGRSVASFSEIFDQIKIAILTTGVVNRPALFVVRLMAWEGRMWDIAFLIHRGRGDRRWQVSNEFQ